MRTVFEMGFYNEFRGPALGQFGIPEAISVGLQVFKTGFDVYSAKRNADRIKQAKERAEEQQKQAEAAQAAADAAKKKAIEAQTAQAAGLTPDGTPGSQNKILGLDPMVFAGGGLALLGIGAAAIMAFRK